MANTGTLSTRDKIVVYLSDKGPMKIDQLTPLFPGIKNKTIHDYLIEWRNDGVLILNEESKLWSLNPEADLKSLGLFREEPDVSNPEGSGEAPPAAPAGGSGADSKSVAAPPSKEGADIMSLEPTAQFKELLRSVGVKPADVIPTITYLFFRGDIDDLNWLYKILRKDAASWVSPSQVRLIMSFWSNTRGLPFQDEQFPVPEETRGRGGKTKEEPAEEDQKRSVWDKAGLGFKIGKDNQGDWVVVPGGPLTYVEAVEAARDRAAITAINKPVSSEDDDDDGEGTTTPSGKSKKGQKFDPMAFAWQKMIENMFDKKGGQNGEADPMVAELRQQNAMLAERLDAMEKQKEQEWRERVEDNIAALAQRDPFSDPSYIPIMRQKLGISGTSVTDSSPAVQLLKDSADKMDKNVERLTGLVERFVLKSDQLNAENTRTPDERNQKAGELLNQVQGRSHSVQLRNKTFGL